MTILPVKKKREKSDSTQKSSGVGSSSDPNRQQSGQSTSAGPSSSKRNRVQEEGPVNVKRCTGFQLNSHKIDQKTMKMRRNR
ncbi:hypothetical protein CRE_21633 [Caenorhabditis remanei]|uniref:Uncharacterized protein n=1 Tax=Caenorhabditis remanei TaxID=31234 RepID=E3NPY9_CAERE|nr:hypothetical protein CRE_21633 [Caenorhabditis remanei]